MRAERGPELLVQPFADQVQVELAERRSERVRVAHDDGHRIRVGDLEVIAGQRVHARQGGLEHARGMLQPEVHRLALLGQHAHRRRRRAKRAHDEPAVGLVDAEHAVRIRVIARDEALGVFRRHAASGTPGDPAASVRRSDSDGIGIVNLPRSSGILLHVTSLPGGRLGPAAYGFVDWLAAAGQSWWQVLPLGPPDRAGSPYTSSSAFAAWSGLLAEPDADVSRDELEVFRDSQTFWIHDWERFAGSGSAADQVRFEREWSALRSYAAERGVRLIGDVPLYVGAGSADHLAHPDLFQRGFVAGAPPDALSASGQLWGNPLYDWPALRRAWLWLVDRASAPRVTVVRSGSHRSFPRLRRLLVGARARSQRARRALAARARQGECSRRHCASSARCR